MGSQLTEEKVETLCECKGDDVDPIENEPNPIVNLIKPLPLPRLPAPIPIIPAKRGPAKRGQVTLFMKSNLTPLLDGQGRSHLTWFTLGDKRQGIFYAHTDDYGKTSSEPMQLGDTSRLSGHPDVLAVNNRVVIAWKEFDGSETSIVIKESFDRGVSWSKDKKILSSTAKSGYPELVSNGKSIFLSWASSDHVHRLMEIKS